MSTPRCGSSNAPRAGATRGGRERPGERRRPRRVGDGRRPRRLVGRACSRRATRRLRRGAWSRRPRRSRRVSVPGHPPRPRVKVCGIPNRGGRPRRRPRPAPISWDSWSHPSAADRQRQSRAGELATALNARTGAVCWSSTGRRATTSRPPWPAAASTTSSSPASMRRRLWIRGLPYDELIGVLHASGDGVRSRRSALPRRGTRRAPRRLLLEGASAGDGRRPRSPARRSAGPGGSTGSCRSASPAA